MADVLIETGGFATDSVLGLTSREFTTTVELRFAFTVTANPSGFVARALPADGSDPIGAAALISGTGVHVVVPGEVPPGLYIFQIESQGGTVAASSYSLFFRDPNEPEPGGGEGEPGTTTTTTVEPPLMVVKADQKEAPGYHDGR